MGTRVQERVREPGGARRDRTADLLHAMQALSQLSYSPAKDADGHCIKLDKSLSRKNIDSRIPLYYK